MRNRKSFYRLSILFLALLFLVTFTSSIAIAEDVYIVSMGDSYSSGEGNPHFYYYEKGVPERYKYQDFLAHRSENSWPGRLEITGTKDKTWFFVASSGAETRHILTDKQKKHYTDSISWSSSSRGGKQTHTLISDTGMIDRQLDVFDKKLDRDTTIGEKVDYVTLTIGGNDVGFADIVGAAHRTSKLLNPDAFDEKLDAAEKTFDKLKKKGGKLEQVYGEIYKAAGKRKEVRIIIAGYPTLIAGEDRRKTGFHFDKNVADKLNVKINKINDELKILVEGMNTKYDTESFIFADVRGEFLGHEIYTNESYLNGIILGRQDEDLSAPDPPPASPYSVHPNEEGIKAYVRAVDSAIKEDATQQKTTQSTSLVFDVSTSMDDSSANSSTSKLETAKDQGAAIVSSVENSSKHVSTQSKIGIVSFSDDADVVQKITGNYGYLRDKIDDLGTVGGTNIKAGLQRGVDQLKSANGDKLMVFLSDGVDTDGNSYDDIMAVAKKAKKAKIKIYTIGFGNAGDIDEALLQDIADTTGGKYSFQDSANIVSASVGILGLTLKAQMAATSQVLIDDTGTVAQDELADVGDFEVAAHGDIQTALYWPGSQLDLRLTDPDGVAIDESYPGYSLEGADTLTQVFITNAKRGTWNMSVYGADVSMEEEPYYAISALTETPEESVPPETTSTPQTPTISAAPPGDNSAVLLFFVMITALFAVGAVWMFSKKHKVAASRDEGGSFLDPPRKG
jgi:Mg-chelatase subunit ChlD